MQPPTALSCPPSLAACNLAEYVGGLFGKSPSLVTLQRSRLVGLNETAAALGLDDANRFPLVSMMQTASLGLNNANRLPWSHIVGLALMVSR